MGKVISQEYVDGLVENIVSDMSETSPLLKRIKENDIIDIIKATQEEYSSIVKFENIGENRLIQLEIEGNSVENDGKISYVENPIINIRNKNLAEKIYSNRNSQYQCLVGVNALGIVPNKQYTISFDIKQDISKPIYLNEKFSTASSRYFTVTKGKNVIKSTFGNSDNQFEVLIKNWDVDITTYDIENIQIEEGEEATDYELRKGKTVRLDGVILRKTEEVADVLFFDTKIFKWCIKRFVDENGIILEKENVEILDKNLQDILNNIVVDENMYIEIHCKNGVVPHFEANVLSKNYTKTLLNVCNSKDNSIQFIHCENGRFYHENGEEFFLQGMNDGDHHSLNGTVFLREFYADWFKQWNNKVNTIRLLMSSKWFEFDEEPFVYRESGFIYLDRVIEEAKKNNIRLILDMHRNQGGFQGWDNNGFRTDEKIERLAKLMGEFAKRYANEPTVLGFGIWNEPVIEYINSSPAESIEKYKEVIQSAIDEIRKYDKKHIIFIQTPQGYYTPTSDTEIKSSDITWRLREEWKEYIPTFKDGMKNICLEWHCYLKPNFYGDERFGYYKSKVTTNILNYTYGGTVVEAYDNTKDGEWQTVSFKPSTWNNKPVNVYRPSFKIQYYPIGTKLYIRNIKYEVLNSEGEIIETDTFLPNEIIKSDTNSLDVVELDGGNVMVFGVNSGETSYSDIVPMTYFTKDADNEDSKFYYEIKVVLPEGTDTTTLNENRGIVCSHKEYYVEDVDGILDRYNINTYYDEYDKFASIAKEHNYNGIFIGETGYASVNESIKTINILKQLEDFRTFIADKHIGFCYYILGNGQYEDFLRYSEEARKLVRQLYIDSTEYSDTKIYRVGDIEKINEEIEDIKESKLNIKQSTDDAGKTLVIGDDGNIKLADKSEITKTITLTQEEYDALTDEEKNNGVTYFISDADTDLTIDEKVNEESVNLVTNKAVATAIKEQINDTQVSTDKTYSSKKIESLIDDTAYTPDMYDRNANGDMPVVGFDRLANNMFLIQNQALIKEGETYDEDYVGGWVYTSANDVLTKEMFNKIKCIVAIPGVLRIGIMNERLWDANPRYSTCLVKWLVSDFVAYTGLKEYDIEDTILEEGQYLFIECRAGESSWYYNSSTEAVKIGDVTYPASSCTSGLNVADKLDSTTNNVVFKSQSVTSTSARTYFGNGQYNVGSKYRTNFLDRHCTSTARTAPKPQDQSLYQGGLNVGLYRRTKYSDTRFCKCVENGMNISWVGDDSVTKIYAAIGQEEIVGKSVYAFKLDVNTPGNLTIYHLKGKSLDTIEIIDKYTHYVRAKGLQTIHLPFDIKLESEDEYIGFGGLHFKSTSNNIVRHGCKWQYMAGDQTTGSCGWMNTIGKTGFYSIGVSMTSYPETFTSFETNGSYLNIELICRGEKRSPLEDKYISFTGDSITTFANFVTTQAGYPVGNTAGDNAYYYPASGKVINNVDATWWGILARDNRMQILRNDAWSGSRVSSATGSTDTKCLCGTERRYYLRNTYEPTIATTYPFGIPEIVVNMIGTNDLSGNVELGEEMFKGVVGAEDEYKTILSAYSLMCRRFAAEYNKNGAKVVHFIIPRGSDWGYANSNGVTIADLSLAFERIAKVWGQYFIPLSYFTGFNPAQYKKNTCPTVSVHRNFRGTEFSNADGLHPNVVGMEILADGVDRFLKEIV